MSDIFDKEDFELYKKIIQSTGIKEFEGIKEFDLVISFPLRKFTKFLIKENISDNSDIIFIYQNYSFIHRHIKELLANKEDNACCSADKSRKIINTLITHFETGKEIEFDHNSNYFYL